MTWVTNICDKEVFLGFLPCLDYNSLMKCIQIYIYIYIFAFLYFLYIVCTIIRCNKQPYLHWQVSKDSQSEFKIYVEFMILDIQVLFATNFAMN